MKLVYIGGYGRSGSTLLDLLLGQLDGVFSMGEVRHLWKEGVVENRLCGCGRPFADCPFWAEVGEKAFGGFGSLNAAEILALKDRVDRWTRVPILVAQAKRGRRQGDLDRYLDLLERLYEAVGAVSGCEVLIDSSKDVSHGYVLQSLSEETALYVLHVVRDSRAVAYAWAERVKHNPGSGRPMDARRMLRTVAEWSAINAMVATQRHLGRYYRLRYEDLASEPTVFLRKALAFLGLRDRELPLTDGAVFHPGENHTVAGNPVRFERLPRRIQLDDHWRRHQSRPARLSVGAVTAPFLLKYGYFNSTRHSWQSQAPETRSAVP